MKRLLTVFASLAALLAIYSLPARAVISTVHRDLGITRTKAELLDDVRGNELASGV